MAHNGINRTYLSGKVLDKGFVWDGDKKHLDFLLAVSSTSGYFRANGIFNCVVYGKRAEFLLDVLEKNAYWQIDGTLVSRAGKVYVVVDTVEKIDDTWIKGDVIQEYSDNDTVSIR